MWGFLLRFFVWHNTTRLHVWSFLSEHYKNMMNADTNYGLEEAGMAQLDDSVGALLKALDDMGEANNTIVVFSTDNGAETFTWPDGGMTPFRASKGTIYEGPWGRALTFRVLKGNEHETDYFPRLQPPCPAFEIGGASNLVRTRLSDLGAGATSDGRSSRF
jgi:hypothetical protein